jgi:ergothioneine biosynthesis protein EgtB
MTPAPTTDVNTAWPDQRPGLLQRLAEARAHTDALFAGLSAEALYERPVAERHRLVFYIGHLEAFDWNLLAAQAPSHQPAYDRLFAFGIDPVGTALPQDQPQDWPPLRDVLAYRDEIRRAVDARLADVPLQRPGPWASGDGRFDGACLLNVAIEHRLMHAETLAYLLHRLPLGTFRAGTCHAGTVDAGAPRGAVSAVPRHEPVSIPIGTVTLGLARTDAATFGWDNEYPQQVLEVPAFAIDRHMVSNGQYLAFVESGGYDDPVWWLDADWAWKVAQRVSHPSFWRRGAGTRMDRDMDTGSNTAGPGWRLRTMCEEIALPLDWPVYVSHAEASAYARWAGMALPSEAQWQRASLGAVSPGRPGNDAGALQGNFDFQRWDPEPVQTRRNVSGFGVVGLYGNGWEWTGTPFAAVEGFEPFPFYRGYSQDFFDGRHFVLKGGSPRTAACMVRPSFRNWFQPHYPPVYAGFRCVTP